MCKVRSIQIFVLALAIVILIGLAVIVYEAFFAQMLRLDSPVGGATWAPDQDYPIRWAARGGIQNVRLEYSIDGGPYQAIAQVPAEDGVYTWTTPAIDWTAGCGTGPRSQASSMSS